MYKNTRKNAFTLVEIMVVVAVITLIIIWGSQLDFSRLSQKQKWDIESVKIISIFEEARNNALLWKSTLSWSTLINPKWWEIRVDEATSSGTISWNYSLNWIFTDSIILSNFWWVAKKPFYIKNLRCTRIDGTGIQNPAWASIRFLPSSKMELRCWSATLNAQDKILELELSSGTFTNTIRINTLSGTIE